MEPSNDTENIERLRLAFPAGYVIGTATIGGCVVLGMDVFVHTVIEHGKTTRTETPGPFAIFPESAGFESCIYPHGDADLLAGVLLPCVDPSLPGTWAILLAELAKLLGIVKPGEPAPTGYAWARTEVPSGAWWTLRAFTVRPVGEAYPHATFTPERAPRVAAIEDPADALIEAYICAREKIARGLPQPGGV